jgi:hypothetical protein
LPLEGQNVALMSKSWASCTSVLHSYFYLVSIVG